MALEKTLAFLNQLKDNNNRPWFQEHKANYSEAKNQFDGFVNRLIPLVKGIDAGLDLSDAKACTFRIYRDVRFAKDKSPYKINFGAFIARGGRKSPFAGYYLHCEPGGSFVGGGAHMPASRFLRAIRTRIYENTDEFKAIIEASEFKKYFKEIYGEKLKTTPRGFPKDFAEIDLLRHKHYSLAHTIADDFWTAEDAVDRILDIFSAQYPFNTFINTAVEKALME